MGMGCVYLTGSTLWLNKIYMPTAGNITECGMSLREWQQSGHDKGIVAGTFPDDRDLVAMRKSLLILGQN